MTLSPFTSRQVKPRPDLPKYELNRWCAAPFCALESTDNHHTLAKGMGWPRKSDYWWAELPNGSLVPVRMGVCRQHHHELTVHEAKLEWWVNRYAWLDRVRADWSFVGYATMPVEPRMYAEFPYVCLECAARNDDVVCIACLGRCVPVGVSPLAREDKERAEGLA